MSGTVNRLVIATIIIHKPRRLTASSSDSGSIMDNSKRKHAMIPMIPEIEIKSANNPKASGPYNRVRIGDARIVSSWAKAVPLTIFVTSKINCVCLGAKFSIIFLSP